MRRLTYLAVGLAALVTAAVAVAHGVNGAKSARAVAGTFSATAANTTTRTCTTADGKTIAVTSGRYTGTAAGDPDLTGPITLTARSVINTTDGVGTVEGRMRIDVAAGRDTGASYAAVYDHGAVAGLALGHARDPHARLLGNLSAGFAPATGFTAGKLGGGTAGGAAVELGPGSCEPSRTRPERSDARGTISALSTASITVSGLTCAIPPDRSADVNARFKLNDRAEIHCSFANGQNTLTKIEKRH